MSYTLKTHLTKMQHRHVPFLGDMLVVRYPFFKLVSVLPKTTTPIFHCFSNIIKSMHEKVLSQLRAYLNKSSCSDRAVCMSCL